MYVWKISNSLTATLVVWTVTKRLSSSSLSVTVSIAFFSLLRTLMFYSSGFTFVCICNLAPGNHGECFLGHERNRSRTCRRSVCIYIFRFAFISRQCWYLLCTTPFLFSLILYLSFSLSLSSVLAFKGLYSTTDQISYWYYFPLAKARSYKTCFRKKNQS